MSGQQEISYSKSVISIGVLIVLGLLVVGAMCNYKFPTKSVAFDSMESIEPKVMNAPEQLAAFQQNALALPMGVTLTGKGYVETVTPGSQAERAGIQVGDVINRINGR